MTPFTANVRWQRAPDEAFVDGKYQRGHQWSFDGGVTFRGSSSPHVVPRYSDPAAVDPEEAFVASLSSCHMLTFLHLAARAGHLIDAYDDAATGQMAKTPEGRFWVSQVTLRPRVTWGGTAPTPEAEDDLHHRAHDECFIANSVRSDVVCAPQR